MRKMTVGISVLALALFLGWGFTAHAAGKAKKYEVVDVACYVKDGKKATGEGHKTCAMKCISGGGELALMRDGKLYIPVDKDFKSAREQFVSKAGETVEVEGKVISKGGVNYLQISGGEEKKDAM